jgi:cytochrome P450
MPERWLGDPAYRDDRRECFQPFAYGPRDCLGQNMALHEMRLIIARLFFKFNLELCEESSRWDDQKAFVLWEKKPLMCRLAVAAT